MDANTLSNQIIGAAIEVHRQLGPGLLENAYQNALAYEMHLKNIPFEPQKSIPVIYKGVALDCDYRVDFLVGDLVIVELKAVDQVIDVHKAQVLTYLKLTGCSLGLLINFNVTKLINGLERLVLGSPPKTPFPGQRTNLILKE